MAIGEYISTAEAAEVLHVTPGRVRQFAIEKRLHFKKVGTVLLFKAQDIKDFAKKKREPGRPKSEDFSKRS